MQRLLYLFASLALVGCATTSETTLDERGYLGLNAGYEFAAETLVSLNLQGEAAANANAKRAAVFKALCKARLAYNLANRDLGRVSTPRCVAALGPNPQVTGYDAELLTAAAALAELRTVVKGD